MGRPLTYRPEIGDFFTYVPPRGRRIAVECVGFRRSFVITKGLGDGRRRDVPISRLEIDDK